MKNVPVLRSSQASRGLKGPSEREGNPWNLGVWDGQEERLWPQYDFHGSWALFSLCDPSSIKIINCYYILKCFLPLKGLVFLLFLKEIETCL